MNDPVELARSALDLERVRKFVVVAEELHFGRAAQRLGMAQPPLSRAIRDLEHQLGVRLLVRTTRQVTLTPAGEDFLREVRVALHAIEAAARRARNAGAPRPRLRVALKADNDAGLLPAILTGFQDEPAALPVELVLGGRGEQVRALRDGRADVALLVGPVTDPGLDAEPLVTEPSLVALAATDPLARRPGLSLADFAGRSLPDGRPADGRAVAPAGPPALVAETQRRAQDLTEIFKLVELGSVICFLPVSITSRYPRPEIAYRPVRDLPPTTLSVAWPRDTRSAAVAAFVRVAVATAANRSGTAGVA